MQMSKTHESQLRLIQIKEGLSLVLSLVSIFVVFSAGAYCTPVFAQSAKIIRVPLIRQATDYTCGVAALQAILAYYGEDVREDILAKALRANQKDGTRYKNIAKYAQAHGLAVQIQQEMTLAQLKKSIQSRHPVICLIQAWAEKETDYKTDWNDGHYVIAVGFDDDKLIFMDPSTAGHYTYIPLQEFGQRWHDIDGAQKLNHFGMIFSKVGTSFDPDKLESLDLEIFSMQVAISGTIFLFRCHHLRRSFINGFKQ
jgi:predicted double-glycine peptidase